MPSNIEIKAVLRDPEAAVNIASRLSSTPPEIIHQEDTFFATPDGARLKLRVFDENSAELIRYERPDVAGTRCSHYLVARTPDPKVLLEILARTVRQVGIVKKKRLLYMVGQTRVHIDEVDGLGDFLELEVVLRPGQSEFEGIKIAEGLMTEFGIAADDLRGEAYIDLLRKSAAETRLAAS